ncbi:uncharacterized protein TNCV_4379271 [Trichonephila clavipes]|nr:uncharacterized protein TNCV_4379271 [Trichonephila clavipes]
MASAVLADSTRCSTGDKLEERVFRKKYGCSKSIMTFLTMLYMAMEESENDIKEVLTNSISLAVCGRALSCWEIARVRPFRKGPISPNMGSKNIINGASTRLSSGPKTNPDSSLNTTFCQSVTFHVDLAWHHCRRSCRCSGVKGSARKGRLDLRFASARWLEIVCGTIATPTFARIVERVTVGSTSACRTILRSCLLVVFLVTPDRVFRAWVPSRVHCSQHFLTAHSERSTWPATRCIDKPAVFIPMIRPLSNSLNYEKCLLARLPGMFRLPKSSYNRRLIVTFMNLRIGAGLYSTLFLIVAPPRRV